MPIFGCTGFAPPSAAFTALRRAWAKHLRAQGVSLLRVDGIASRKAKGGHPVPA